MTDSTTQQPDQTDSIGRIAELISGDPMARIDADMKHVLDALGELGARPLEISMPIAARRQPKAADVVAAILARQGREVVDDGVAAEDLDIENGEGTLASRIYRPVGLLSRLNPVILYFHGGGFVTGSLDTHDASARALARRTGAIVISVDYRLAPEHKFPAAHEDAWAAWTWLTRQVRDLGGDPRRLAVAGEDAGANLAAYIALRARDEHTTQPVHQLLVHPMAGTDMTTASYGETLRVQPVGMPAMRWRFRHLLEDEAALADPRLDLVHRDDLAGVAPATIILADIDPLRSEGEALAEALEQAGVPVNCWSYEGVTQGFFGLGLVVTKALFAQSDAAEALARSFGPSRRS
ncbi:alpha/beta hydrolase [Devosia sp. SL43]|uniref:alpha/beta hydrolase n=1 Tax=Devosia sp. SL43 TaxID=2806348 RepID=UPI001F43B460|nr:alpha/beta hydrolase [Devosia sp. SL43]UJW84364.1 alpha/beta hydrolase [Devosia sp. SL43]